MKITYFNEIYNASLNNVETELEILNSNLHTIKLKGFLINIIPELNNDETYSLGNNQSFIWFVFNKNDNLDKSVNDIIKYNINSNSTFKKANSTFTYLTTLHSIYNSIVKILKKLNKGSFEYNIIPIKLTKLTYFENAKSHNFDSYVKLLELNTRQIALENLYHDYNSLLKNKKQIFKLDFNSNNIYLKDLKFCSKFKVEDYYSKLNITNSKANISICHNTSTNSGLLYNASGIVRVKSELKAIFKEKNIVLVFDDYISPGLCAFYPVSYCCGMKYLGKFPNVDTPFWESKWMEYKEEFITWLKDYSSYYLAVTVSQKECPAIYDVLMNNIDAFSRVTDHYNPNSGNILTTFEKFQNKRRDNITTEQIYTNKNQVDILN